MTALGKRGMQVAWGASSPRAMVKHYLGRSCPVVLWEFYSLSPFAASGSPVWAAISCGKKTVSWSMDSHTGVWLVAWVGAGKRRSLRVWCSGSFIYTGSSYEYHQSYVFKICGSHFLWLLFKASTSPQVHKNVFSALWDPHSRYLGTSLTVNQHWNW